MNIHREITHSIAGIRIIENKYMTKTEEYTVSKPVARRGFSRRVKAYRQVPSDEIIIVDNQVIMHPQTAQRIKNEMSARFVNLADEAFYRGAP
jgi:hypothetical protein